MTSLDQLNADFRELLVALGREDADFLIVGAYALAYHGHPRATGDIDILVRKTPENAKRVHAALEQFGPPLAALGIRESDFVKDDLVCQLGVPPRRIDLLTDISGLTYDEAWSTHETRPLDGYEIALLGVRVTESQAPNRASFRPRSRPKASTNRRFACVFGLRPRPKARAPGRLDSVPQTPRS